MRGSRKSRGWKERSLPYLNLFDKYYVHIIHHSEMASRPKILVAQAYYLLYGMCICSSGEVDSVMIELCKITATYLEAWLIHISINITITGHLYEKTANLM
jgi:hypothetical protein